MKSTWKSIDELRGRAHDATHNLENPPEGLPSGMDRRTFLSLMGASAALAGLAGCRRPEDRIVPYVSKPEDLVLGIPQRYATTMPFGLENIPLLVTSHEGRPTHIEGNPLDPSTAGAVNVWTSASILDLYDPDRSQVVRNAGAEAELAAFVGDWQVKHAGFVQTQGEGLAVLSGSFASPTLARLAGEFRARFPKAQWVTYDAVNDDTIVQGCAAATGQRAIPVYDFTNADVVLSLDADLFGTESNAITNAHGFASRRRIRSTNDTMNRLYLVEGTLSTTASMADHRLPVRSGLINACATAIAEELRRQGLALPAFGGPAVGAGQFDTRWIAAVAKDLLAHRGRCVIAAGRRQPPAVHALAAALNAALGNVGTTVKYLLPRHAESTDTAAFEWLVTLMNAGKVQTLVVLDTNPVYSAPADLAFGEALAKVGTIIHAGQSFDETAAAATWHVPLHHYLESWGDVSTFHGSHGVVQPLIAPLYTGMSLTEMAALVSGGAQIKGYDAVVQTWKALLPAAGFDAAFTHVLHDGRFESDALPSMSVDMARAAAFHTSASVKPAAVSATALEVSLQASPAVYDGRFANNGWLQEFPDPVTKITWDNAAIMSEATAAALGVRNEDFIRLTSAAGNIGLPVWIMPGQADFTVTVNLGYGRKNCGRIGDAVGDNGYRLRSSASPYIVSGVTMQKIRGTHRVACVQDHHGLDSEDLARRGIQERLPMIVREATLEEYQHEPNFAKERVEHPALRSTWDEHTYNDGFQWGMSIDLNACTGCGACTIACQSENNIPIVGKEQVLNGREMHWIRIDRYYAGSVEQPEVLVQPLGCVQCEMAPCEQVCPVAATSHDEEGLNVMTYNRCVGTRYCSNNCPYKARRFNFFNYAKEAPETVQMARNPEVTVRFRGVMEKCTYCVQRIATGKIAAKRDGRALADGDIVAACESACPTRAIVFGDTRDEKSRISAAKKLDRDYALLGELNVRPRTTYLAKLRNPNPDLASGKA